VGRAGNGFDSIGLQLRQDGMNDAGCGRVGSAIQTAMKSGVTHWALDFNSLAVELEWLITGAADRRAMVASRTNLPKQTANPEQVPVSQVQCEWYVWRT
jgi:hypothetical protein